MKKFLTFTVCIFLIACGGKPSADVEKTTAPPPKDSARDLSAFVGKAPNELFKDANIARAINETVPSEMQPCLHDLLNKSPALDRLADGTLHSEAAGTRDVENRLGYISITPRNVLDVVLWCESDPRSFHWYSSAPVENDAPRDMVRWLQMLITSISDPTLWKHGEGYRRMFTYDLVVAGQLASPGLAQKKKKAAERNAQRAPGAVYAVRGSVLCANAKSFNKVAAIERSGNHYATMPDDCETLGEDLQLNLISRFNDAFIGELALVGNSNGTAYVRTKDLE